MHMQAPAYDTRRGCSLHRGYEGYDEADAIADRRERERALSAVRSAANRDIRASKGTPTPHQVTAILADALGLLIEDTTVHSAIKRRLRECLRRAIRHRDADPDDAEVRRVVLTRMRANPRLVDMERHERIARQVEEERKNRSEAYLETIRIINSLRDGDEGA